EQLLEAGLLSGRQHLFRLGPLLAAQFLDLLLQLVDLAPVLRLDLVDTLFLLVRQSQFSPFRIELPPELRRRLLGIVRGARADTTEQPASGEEADKQSPRRQE